MSPATPSSRLSAHRNRCCTANGSSSGSGFLHLVLSNNLPVFSLYSTCSVTTRGMGRGVRKGTDLTCYGVMSLAADFTKMYCTLDETKVLSAGKSPRRHKTTDSCRIINIMSNGNISTPQRYQRRPRRSVCCKAMVLCIDPPKN